MRLPPRIAVIRRLEQMFRLVHLLVLDLAGPVPLVSRSSTPLQTQPEVSDDAVAAEAPDEETVHPPPSIRRSAALPVATSSPATRDPLIAQQIAVDGAGMPGSSIPVAEAATLKIMASSDKSYDAGSLENGAAAEQPHPVAFPDANSDVNAHSTPKDVAPPSSAVPTEAPLIPSVSSSFAQDDDMGLAGTAPGDTLGGSAIHTPRSLRVCGSRLAHTPEWYAVCWPPAGFCIGSQHAGVGGQREREESSKAQIIS